MPNAPTEFKERHVWIIYVRERDSRTNSYRMVLTGAYARKAAAQSAAMLLLDDHLTVKIEALRVTT